MPAAKLGIDTPTLCYGETLMPANACRICVVELEGARTLVPACSRKVEPDMVIQHRLRARAPQPQDGDRVPGLVGRPVDHPGGAGLPQALRRASPSATDRRRPRTPSATTGTPGHHERPDGQTAATVHAPAKVDNDLYVRDYSKCILCYKCVDACGEQYQNTFAITVAGRGFDARISTEYANPLPDSACVYCGNCIAVCPTGALMFRSEHDLREAAAWDESRQTQTDTICPYCGVGCNLTLHVQDNQIVKVTSPDDHDITRGNLCIKGRFGFQHVDPKPDPSGST